MTIFFLAIAFAIALNANYGRIFTHGAPIFNVVIVLLFMVLIGEIVYFST